MSSFIEELLKWLGSLAVVATALSAAVAWLVKTLTSYVLSKDVEAYKSNLQRESSLEIERFKSALTVAAKEGETRFNKLHEKRLEVISELFELLEDASLSAKTFVHILSKEPSPSEQELSDSARRTLEICIKPIALFRKNRLYFDESTANTIDELLYDFQSPAGKYDIAARLPEESYDRETIIKAWNQKEPEVRKLRGLLEDDFRKILGSASTFKNGSTK